MSLEFDILFIENSLLVLLKTNKRLPEVINLVQDKIKGKNYSGKIIFDLIVNNGLSNRFFEIPCNQNGLNIRELKKVTSLNISVTKSADEYYKQHIDIIRNSYISRVEKARVLKALSLI